jgi:hypothetical protein
MWLQILLLDGRFLLEMPNSILLQMKVGALCMDILDIVCMLTNSIQNRMRNGTSRSPAVNPNLSGLEQMWLPKLWTGITQRDAFSENVLKLYIVKVFIKEKSFWQFIYPNLRATASFLWQFSIFCTAYSQFGPLGPHLPLAPPSPHSWHTIQPVNCASWSLALSKWEDGATAYGSGRIRTRINIVQIWSRMSVRNAPGYLWL